MTDPVSNSEIPVGASSAARHLTSQLTVEEKVALLSGSDAWRTASVDRLDIPAIKVSDGPNGVRGDGTTGARAVCLPASVSLAASFDTELVTELGRLLGRETARKGAHVLLAPTVNLARHPLGGRNFESFGEEPLLTAALAVAYIEGVQDEGVGACVKHFVANDIEEARLTVSSEVDATTLREVYLAPFEAAVEAGVWSIMAAYPKLNGVHCSENRWLLTDLLRNEWGFDGLVMSDWGATHHPTKSVDAGLDLEMPGPPKALGPRLLAAVEAGEVSTETLDARAATVVDLAVRADRIGLVEEPEQSVDLPEERRLVRKAAADGMVLLTNRVDAAGQTVLPLDPSIKSLAVIGPNAEPGVIQGGGSAALPAHHITSPAEGLRQALPHGSVTVRPGCLAERYMPPVEPDRWATTGEGGERPLAIETFDNLDLSGPAAVTGGGNRIQGLFHTEHPKLPQAGANWSQRWTGRLSVDVGGSHEFGVIAVGRARVLVDGQLVVDNWTEPELGEAFFGFGSTEVTGSIDLEAGSEPEVVVEWSSGGPSDLWGLRFGHLPPTDEDALMEEAVAAAAAADAAVVVVGLNAEWETEGHDRPLFGLPGRQDELVRRVAEVNDNTAVVLNAGGPLDLPWLDEVPAAVMAWYPGQEFGGALADVIFGQTDPGGRLPITFPRALDRTPTASSVPGDGRLIKYDEGLFVGHRWYREHGVDPLLPFGHGLSYTSFDIGTPTLIDGADQVGGADGHRVVVQVDNVGQRAGKCVVQLYLDPGLPGRPRVLAGFGAVSLDPGTGQELTLPIDSKALRRWDDEAGEWAVLAGTHRLDVALSADRTVHTIPFTVDVTDS